MARKLKDAGKQDAKVERKSNVPDEVYERHLGEIEAKHGEMAEAQEALASARGAYRAALKAAKKDGCNADAITDALKERKKDVDERKTHWRDVGRILRLMKSPLGTQFGLFEEAEAVTFMDIKSAEAAGRKVGKAGGNLSDCPLREDHRFYSAWVSGYDAGQAENAPKPTNGAGAHA